MDFVSSLYPPISAREPIPAFYQPFVYLLTLVPFFFHNRKLVAICIFPVILTLCVRAPCYTFGEPSGDYYSTSPFVAIPFWFVEFAILTPREGTHAPTYVGDKSEGNSPKSHGLEPSSSSWKKLSWASSLMVPSHRGIGWNWQVKNVPEDTHKQLTKWEYVYTHTQKALVSYAQSLVMLVVLRCGSTIEKDVPAGSLWRLLLVNTVIGWSGATWVWSRLTCFYSLLAALSVACGICETWQWPPLMGHLRDAWSVRQMWSVVYHQTMRKVSKAKHIRIAMSHCINSTDLS